MLLSVEAVGHKVEYDGRVMRASWEYDGSMM
jgi:hypothetical protein